MQSIDEYVKRTLEQQGLLIDRLSYLSSAGLVLSFLMFALLAIHDKRVRFAENDSDSSEPYSPVSSS
jgi:hypothetical protein